jgi:hypothetical protein
MPAGNAICYSIIINNYKLSAPALSIHRIENTIQFCPKSSSPRVGFAPSNVGPRPTGTEQQQERGRKKESRENKCRSHLPLHLLLCFSLIRLESAAGVIVWSHCCMVHALINPFTNSLF